MNVPAVNSEVIGVDNTKKCFVRKSNNGHHFALPWLASKYGVKGD